MLIPEGRAAAALEAERAGRRGAGLRAGIREAAAAVRPGCVRYGTAAADRGWGLREREAGTVIGERTLPHLRLQSVWECFNIRRDEGIARLGERQRPGRTERGAGCVCAPTGRSL